MLATQQIFLIAALLCFLTFLALLSVASANVRGVRELLLASVLGMVGSTLYAFGRELPPLLAYEAANVTYAAASAALVGAYRHLADLPLHRVRLAVSVGALGVLAALFHYAVDSFLARSVVVSLFQVAVCGEIARAVLAMRRSWQRPLYIYCFVLAMCALVATGHLGRIASLALAHRPPTSLLQPSLLSISFLTAVALALPALAMGGLMMAHRQLIIRAEHAGNHDFLTGASSRKAFFDIAALELARARRNGRPLALVLVDLDHFKGINDRWGHQAGDAALRRLVDSARGALRAVDCVARLGGDEFALLLPDTDLHGAGVVAGKLQESVRQAVSGAEPAPALTLSIGATLITADEDLTSAMGRADEALYAAKAAGRDRVIVKGPAPLALVPVRRRA